MSALFLTLAVALGVGLGPAPSDTPAENVLQRESPALSIDSFERGVDAYRRVGRNTRQRTA